MALTSNPTKTVRGRKTRQATIARHADCLPSVEEMISNLEEVLYGLATEDEWAQGMTWYQRGSDMAESMASDRETGAGIIAALSPQEGWNSNMVLAQSLIETGEAGHTELCVSRAQRINGGESPREVLGGQKVRSFHLNLSLPGNRGPVTIDRHAVAILFGHTLSDGERRILERPGVYERCAAVYRTVARRSGLVANQVQAITWTAWRREHSVAAHDEAF